MRLSDRRVLNALLQDLKVPGCAVAAARIRRSTSFGRRDYAELRRQVDRGWHGRRRTRTSSNRCKNVRTWEQFLQAKGSHAGAIAAGNQLARPSPRCTAWDLEEFLDFDLTIVRGSAYYTGTVFELFDAKRGAAGDLWWWALRQPAQLPRRRRPAGGGIRNGRRGSGRAAQGSGTCATVAGADRRARRGDHSNKISPRPSPRSRSCAMAEFASSSC